MAKISAVEIPSLLLDEQASAPTTPATGFWKLYTKSDGLYIVDDAGTETGPLAASAGSNAFVGARVYHNANQSITNNTLTELAFNSEDEDTDGFHDNATNNQRITIPSGKAGVYAFTAAIEFDVNGTGYREVGFRLNGTNSFGIDRRNATSSENARITASAVRRLSVGDYVACWVRQTSGGNLNVTANTAGSVEFRAGFRAHLIGT